MTPLCPSTFDNIVLVVGGHTQRQGFLERGGSVGHIWRELLDAGYNAYLTAEPENGGNVTWDGAGGAMNSIVNEWATGTTTHGDQLSQLALIGYSHGAGILRNLSDRVFNFRSSTADRVVFAGTIDGVERTAVDNWPPSPLDQSPGALSLGWNALMSNWYQTHFYGVPGLHGTAMNPLANGSPGPSDHLVNIQSADAPSPGHLQTHLSIYRDNLVLEGLESDLVSVFNVAIHHERYREQR